MAIPRSKLFDRTRPVTCHCVSRCVRRIALLQPERRRAALRQRLEKLVKLFAIDVLEWALLDNHFHLVAATHPDLASLWSDAEVARRWRTLTPDYEWRRAKRIPCSQAPPPEEIARALAVPGLVARWRVDLADISVFHKFLKQGLARMINEEDDVTGHCFEGRFKSIVALDEEAVIAHMVYVALNPVRAEAADTLEGSPFSSIAARVADLKCRIGAGEFAGAAQAARQRVRAMALEPALRCQPGEEAKKPRKLRDGRANPWFAGGWPTIFGGTDAGLINAGTGRLGLVAFLSHVDAVGRRKHPKKPGTIAADAPSPVAGLAHLLGGIEGGRPRRGGKGPQGNAGGRGDPARGDAERDGDGSAGAGVGTGRGGRVGGADDPHLRALIEELETSMARGLASPLGNYSGGASSLLRAAEAMGRRCIIGVTGRRRGDRKVGAPKRE
ncbi:MAG TPA: hypothetical protein PKC90_05020 [Phycisphaerales bacterium]|nr:hypothetical protein [Phycisphaerales bacterium]